MINHLPSARVLLPELPLAPWKGTRDALHRFLQMAGKVRLAMAPPQPHWWHVTFYVTSRGLTTSPMPAGDQTFSIDFDLIDHRLVVASSSGQTEVFGLEGLRCAEFYERLFSALRRLGIQAQINPTAYKLGPEDFSTCSVHRYEEREGVHRYFLALIWIDQVFKDHAGRFIGKTSPVHLFWHSFDLAVTRFSGRSAPDLPTADAVTREAYSEEVISFGFWPGDDRVPEAAFYSYTAPEPRDLTAQTLRPEQAHWADSGGGHLALLPYDAVRQAAAPRSTLLEFLASAYQAGARTAHWDEHLVIDPVSRSSSARSRPARAR